MRYALPLPFGVKGLRIGLFGGSFNPPHQGHRDVADEARKRLGLDQVWWLVSLRNPLKPAYGLADFTERVAQVRRLANRPTDRVLTIEARIGSGVTATVLSELLPALRDQRPCWIMGADSFASLHLWNAPEVIMHGLPVAAFARPGAVPRAWHSFTAKRFSRHRHMAHNASALVDTAPPSWVELPMRWNPASSTALRATSDETG